VVWYGVVLLGMYRTVLVQLDGMGMGSGVGGQGGIRTSSGVEWIGADLRNEYDRRGCETTGVEIGGEGERDAIDRRWNG
jgi:hypothetical protein